MSSLSDSRFFETECYFIDMSQYEKAIAWIKNRAKALPGSIRPDKLFTAHKDNLLNLTALDQDKLSEVLSRLRDIFSEQDA